MTDFVGQARLIGWRDWELGVVLKSAMGIGRRRDNRKSFTLLQIKMEEEYFLTEFIPEDEMRLKNSEDLTRLNPSWLTQFPEKQRQEIFFAQVLPVIALWTDNFVNHAVRVSQIPESHIETPLLSITVDPGSGKWLCGFTQLNFNLKEPEEATRKIGCQGLHSLLNMLF
jgi:hypothetical protein